MSPTSSVVPAQGRKPAGVIRFTDPKSMDRRVPLARNTK